MAMRNAIVYVGEQGAETYTQSLNGVLYTEDQIGFMADCSLLLSRCSISKKIKHKSCTLKI